MKKSIFLSFILCLCLVACIPQQAMAQKQSLMEKLLRYLNDNDADKWQKNREKLDDETQTYYSEELALLDVLHQLWNEHSEQAATNYFGCYGKAFQGNFSTICDEEKIQLSDVRNRAEQSIIYILEGSKDKIPFSRAVIDSIRSTDYPADSVMLQRLRDIRELALLECMLKTPTPGTYQTYLAEYPNGKFIAQVNAADLTAAARTHLDDLEYLSEKADFELLKPAIVNSESLSLLKDFLCTHHYKEFRDQANALRNPFVLQAILATPTSVKYYNQGRLIKSVENDSTGNTSTTYTYNEKGQLTSMLSITEKNGQISNEIQTNRLYDPQGHCIFEVKTNPKTKTDIYRQTRRIGADGSIESDSLKYTDGRFAVSTYNKQGQLTETKEYNKNGELQAYKANKYDEKGRLTESQHQNLLFANVPDQILSQKESYEYDKYGYLTRIVYQRITGNNQKTSGYLTCLYDDYGNRIDGNSYYEYDNTGQWIYRAERDNPKETERVQYIYK